jgi:hypothetical protein
MSKRTCRPAVWALALLACLAFGTQSAFAEDGPRVHAEGWFFHNDFANAAGGFSDKVKFGLNGRCNKSGGFTTDSSGNIVCNANKELGEYDYHNQFTDLKSHGKIQTLVIKPMGDPDCAALVGATGPAATVQGGGHCTTGCTDSFGINHAYNFEMTVVDDDDTPATRGNPDAVCKVFVNGYAKDKTPAADADQGNQLNKGDVEVRTANDPHDHH